MFLPDAREWALEEIARLPGRAPTIEELNAANREYDDTKRHFGWYLSNCSLGHLVELILDRCACRGWSEEYCDRLRRAFNAFDPHDKIREQSIEKLKDGRIYYLIEDSAISSGNLRLLKSLLNTVFWNLHDIAGIPVGLTLPNDLRGIQTRPNFQESFLNELKVEDFANLLALIQTSDFNWRSRYCIEMCFYFWVPVRRVMRGRWSQIIDDFWFPYVQNERENWWLQYQRIDKRELNCMRIVRNKALKEGIKSDYWFPQKVNRISPIANVDRAWVSILEELRWPQISLAKCASVYRSNFRPFHWPVSEEREKIKSELETWNYTRST